MKQEIKNRIDQINRGEVPEGYKNTSFGIFPFDICYFFKKIVQEPFQFCCNNC